MPNPDDIDLTKRQAVHIIGVGGSGMAPIAQVLHEMGHRVSGSDLGRSAAFERLEALGVDVRIGHDADNVGEARIVARSTAIPEDNPEVVEVERRGASVLSRADLLAAMCAQRRTVAVAGTHGKTTTSSMLAVIAAVSGDPSFVIGGDVVGFESGAGWGESPWFVVEADESDGTFLRLAHDVGIVTNVEPDHLEHYGGEAPLRRAFVEFAGASRVAVVCADDAGSRHLTAREKTITYGQATGADVRMTDLQRSSAGTTFVVEAGGRALGRVAVPMPGLHNARNATAAIAAALEMEVEFADIVEGLAGFGGVRRRFQARGEIAGVTLVDDYAHLPGEVRLVLDAATDLGAERIVAVFQPHRYSRTEALWQDFTRAFDDADLVVVTDIYSSGEPSRPGVTGKLLVDAIEAGEGHPPVIYAPDRPGLAAVVAPLLRSGDLCLTLGAGDLVTLPDELLAALAGSP